MITLANLHEATEQQIFDQVVAHLRKQNERSMEDIVHGHTCVYRSPYGLKCAAGCLIADEEYTPSMEGNTWDLLASKGYVSRDNQHFILELQRIHDGTEPPFWEDKFKELAHEYNLEYTPPTNTEE